MDNEELRHIVALLIEDAEKLHVIEPNAATQAHIWLAKRAFNNIDDDGSAIRL